MSRRLQSSFGSADESLGLLLWQVTNRWQAAIRAALRPYDLTHVQFVLLASLAWLGGSEPVTQRDLADHAFTDPMMTSQVLRGLEARELVTREPHPDDGRARAVAVTAAGAELADRANAAVEACDTAFFASLGTGHAHFASGLRRLRGPA